MATNDQRDKMAFRLDLAERLLVGALFAYFTFNLASDLIRFGHSASLLLLASEGLVVVLVVLRRRTAQISLRPRDWLLAAAGTVLPLLARPGAESLVPSSVVVGVMVLGMVLQISAKVSLWRSFGLVAANRGVRFRGPYRLVRHPMYAGYIATQLGFLLANPTSWNLAIYAASWLVQLGRIQVEEEVLAGDQDYQRLSESVRYRLVPGIF